MLRARNAQATNTSAAIETQGSRSNHPPFISSPLPGPERTGGIGTRLEAMKTPTDRLPRLQHAVPARRPMRRRSRDAGRRHRGRATVKSVLSMVQLARERAPTRAGRRAQADRAPPTTLRHRAAPRRGSDQPRRRRAREGQRTAPGRIRWASAVKCGSNPGSVIGACALARAAGLEESRTDATPAMTRRARGQWPASLRGRTLEPCLRRVV